MIFLLCLNLGRENKSLSIEISEPHANAKRKCWSNEAYVTENLTYFLSKAIENTLFTRYRSQHKGCFTHAEEDRLLTMWEVGTAVTLANTYGRKKACFPPTNLTILFPKKTRVKDQVF